MKCGSLFTGAGGLDMAVECAFGADTVWHSEIDPAAAKVLAHRYPDTPNLGDITGADWTAVEPVDVLCGGFPCQDVSSAGLRAGMKHGTRSGLWAVYAEAVDALRPAYVVIENVRGLLNAEAHRHLEPAGATMGNPPGRPVLRAAGAVLGDLADLGYDAKWATVSASSVGAPHRRERVFIVAAPHAESVRRRERFTEPARVVGGSDVAVGARDWRSHAASQMDRHSPPMSAIADLLPTPLSSDGNGGKQRSQVALDSGKHQNDLPNINRLLPTPGASDTRGQDYARADREDSGGDDLVTAIVKAHNANQWGRYGPAIARWEHVLGVPAPSPTEPNSRGNPRLNPAFSEWMLGWPGGWVTGTPGTTRNDQLRVIGNGVCPQQAHAALERLLGIEDS